MPFLKRDAKEFKWREKKILARLRLTFGRFGFVEIRIRQNPMTSAECGDLNDFMTRNKEIEILQRVTANQQVLMELFYDVLNWRKIGKRFFFPATNSQIHNKTNGS